MQREPSNEAKRACAASKGVFAVLRRFDEGANQSGRPRGRESDPARVHRTRLVPQRASSGPASRRWTHFHPLNPAAFPAGSAGLSHAQRIRTRGIPASYSCVRERNGRIRRASLRQGRHVANASLVFAASAQPQYRFGAHELRSQMVSLRGFIRITSCANRPHGNSGAHGTGVDIARIAPSIA